MLHLVGRPRKADVGGGGRRRVMLAAALAAAAVVVAACSSSGSGDGSGTSTSAGPNTSAGSNPSTGSAGSASAPAPTRELTWALAGSPRTLFAPTNYSSDGAMLMTLTQDQLLTYDPAGKLRPAIATDWKAVSPTEYTYTIRKGVKFSDGNPLTVDDVVYSLNLQLDKAVASQEAGLFGAVKSITGSGDTVTVTLSKPQTIWQYLPASIGGFIWEKASVEKSLSTYGTPQTLPIGSGPYKVAEFVPDSHVTYVPNPYYWGPTPKFAKLTFQIIPDAQTRLLAMQSGQIDGTFSVDSKSLAQWKSSATVTTFPSYVWQGLTMDMTQAPFSDIHVRRALYYATDRASIVSGLMNGLGQVSTTVNDPQIFYPVLGKDATTQAYDKLDHFDYDIAKAKSELAQSSVPSGFKTTLNVPSDSAGLIAIAQALKASWAQIGVTLNLNLMPGGPRFQVILDHKPNLGIQIIGNVPDVPDPVQMPYQYFSSAQAVQNGNNSSNLKDPAIDALLDQAQSSTDPKKAATLIMQAQQAASEQVPVIPIAWGQQMVALKKGWTESGLGAFYSTSAWIDQIIPG